MDKSQKPTAANGQPEVSAANSSAANSTPDRTAGSTLLDQAGELLKQGNASNLLEQLPKSVKSAGNGALAKISNLSTTQKVVGGALLVAGVSYLASTSGKSKDKVKGKDKSGKKKASTLHELLYFVNDRIVGYQRAVAESQDPKLQGYYKQLVSQSQQFSNTLNNHLRQQDGSRETSTTLKGKLYRAWMDAKALITGFDEKAILGSNIYGEEWALKAYESALDDQTLTGSLRMEVERQYKLSQSTYQELQRLSAKQ